MIKVKCPDCFRNIEIDDDTQVYICRCGACAFDREEYNSQQHKLGLRGLRPIAPKFLKTGGRN